jgi:glycosyltransferase involved in cell wall biosynthesis
MDHAMQDPPLVTIAIPTYNRAAGFLADALRSAVGQTYPNLEIIVSDNCSMDSTEDVVRSFSDPRIIYFKHRMNIGANHNFNFCLDRARGKYFLLLHDDDLIDNDFIQSCMAALDQGADVGVIRTGTRKIDAQGRTILEIPNQVEGTSALELMLGWIRGKTTLFLCSTLYHTQGLRVAGGFHSKKNLFQDDVALFKLAATYGRAEVGEVKASFRRHAGNSGDANSIRDWCEDSLYLLELMCSLEPDHEELLRREGMPFFCWQNYARASRIGSPLERIKSYFLVYRMFGMALSPVTFLSKRKIRRTKGFLRTLKSTVLARPGRAG